ncbi:MAG: DUF427 domain-containing protein [Rhodospirillales bacterium]|jgi:class 3 adenylate cyclase/uncharacterized protein (DUF427 family)|nr:DUF427 domain-containing protein [Rhodospirillales bacterium]
MNETAGSDSSIYRIEFRPIAGRIAAVIDGITVADSTAAVVMHETHLPPIYYFPRADVDGEILRRSERRTFCPFKGTATHWTLRLATRTVEDAGWSYERPLDISTPIEGYIAFYDGVVERWVAEPEVLDALAAAQRPASELPLAEWVMGGAWLAQSASELTEQLGRKLVEVGVPLLRVNVGIWTLHPPLVGTAYTWTRGRDGVDTKHTPRGALLDQSYLKSPVRFVSEGLGGVRQRLDVDEPEFQFPIMDDLRAAGGTDYVAMPLPFSDGQIHTLTLTSDRPAGFSVADLGQVFEAIPMLSRLYEVHTLRQNTAVLLDTYLGSRTGQRVLNGLTQRGDGESIHAVIWFCDLRDSTAMAESVPRDLFLDDLNLFFDCVAGAVLEYGGEILRFIGDAVLAIFPLPESNAPVPGSSRGVVQTCYNAIEAAREAERRVTEVNRGRGDDARPEIRYGIGLHIGDVTYGNIGTRERLEFTVIGAAANEAARIEGLCKSLDATVLISDEFASNFPEALVSMGRHQLRGVGAEREIFTLPQVASRTPA